MKTTIYKLILSALSFTIGLTICAQSQPLIRPSPLFYKVCDPEPMVVSEQDSVRQQAVLDSISILFTGRWELAEEGAGACFVPAHAPDQSTELTLNQQGQRATYVAGKQITTFRLRLSYYWGTTHFVIDQQDTKNYFGFLPPYISRNGRYYDPKFKGQYPNILRVCQETLSLTGPATGLSYIFRRVSRPSDTQLQNR